MSVDPPRRHPSRARTVPTPIYTPPTTFTSKTPISHTSLKLPLKLKLNIRLKAKKGTNYPLPSPVPSKKFGRGLLPTPTITTININDLSSEATTLQAFKRRDQAVDLLSHLAKGTDILAVQETGLTPHNRRYLTSRFPQSTIFYNNLRQGVAGTLVVLSLDLTRRYKTKEIPLPGLEGYIQLLQFSDPADPMDTPSWQFINCYFYTGTEYGKQSRQLNILLSLLTNLLIAPITFLAGDFNFVTNSLDTSSTSRSSLLRKDDLQTWIEILGRLQVEDNSASFHTRFQICREAVMSQSARLDRIYSPISDALLTVYTPHLELVRHWSNGGLYLIQCLRAEARLWPSLHTTRWFPDY